MKYNIDDYVNTPYGNVPIIGTDGINQYIILINNGWKIDLTDCIDYNVNEKYIDKRALYITERDINEKVDTFQCFHCDQKFINLNQNHLFTCWECKIEFL